MWEFFKIAGIVFVLVLVWATADFYISQHENKDDDDEDNDYFNYF